MSLADELLADLEENDHEDLIEVIKQEVDAEYEEAAALESMRPVFEPMEVDVKVSSIRELCKLHDSNRLQNILMQINKYAANPRTSSEMIGTVESDPEYQLIVEANGIAVEIDNEISIIHKFTKEKYQKRFPELDSLIVGEMEYLHTVKVLGNDLEQIKNNEDLQQILTQATIMIVSVTASTTQGTQLSELEKWQIDEACDMAIDLNNFKLRIYEYVESRMTFIAPNLSMIIGASTAAKLLGVAGGLTKLSKMPACNVLVLGSQKRVLSGKKSAVWNFFESKEDGKVKCSLCSSELSFRGGSTFNLARHLTSKHPTVYESQTKPKPSSSQSQPHLLEEESQTNVVAGSSFSDQSSASSSSAYAISGPPAKQPRIQQSVSQLISKPLPVSESKQIDRQLVRMIVKEYQPISIVEGSEFKTLIQMLNPEYSLPSGKKISDKFLPRLYSETKEKVLNSLKSAESVTITTDCWTSSSNQNYIAMTVHFINDDCSLVSHLLDCFEFSEHHTSEILANEMKRVVAEWKLQNKICAVVTDNTPNISSAVRSNCDWPHITCFAHSINEIVLAGLKEIKETQDKVKSIVEFFKTSFEATNTLLTIERQMGFDEKKLKQEVPTRWSSTYYMFSRILELKGPVLSTLSLTNSALTLSQKDWQIIEKSCKMLYIFEQVTVVLSNEKTVSISMVMVLCNAIKSELEDISEQLGIEDPEELEKMLAKLLEELSKRLSVNGENTLLAEAVLLDPRFKRQGFSQEHLFKQAYKGISRQASSINISNQTSRLRASESTDAGPSSTLPIWRNFDNKMSKIISNPIAAGIAELDKYLQEPYIRRDSDPLLWWKEHKLLYPRLFKIMKKRLCVMATSVPCGRVFSKSGQLLTERRNMLTSSKVRNMIFLHNNL